MILLKLEGKPYQVLSLEKLTAHLTNCLPNPPKSLIQNGCHCAGLVAMVTQVPGCKRQATMEGWSNQGLCSLPPWGWQFIKDE